MSSVTTLTRSAAQALVEREERRVGRMVAYEVVAQAVGSSADWIRKFVNGYDCAKRPDVEVGFNILNLYDRIIGAVDENSAKIEQENQALRLKIYEAVPRTVAQRFATIGADAAQNTALVERSEG